MVERKLCSGGGFFFSLQIFFFFLALSDRVSRIYRIKSAQGSLTDFSATTKILSLSTKSIRSFRVAGSIARYSTSLQNSSVKAVGPDRRRHSYIGSMKSAIQVLTSINAESTGPSFILHTQEGKRYIIGRVPEGFQRLFNENRLRATRVEEIMVTGPIDWSSFGGLPGFLLTVANVSNPSDGALNSNTTTESGGKLRLFASSGVKQRLENAIDSWKYFIFHNAIKLSGERGNFVKREFQDDFVSTRAIDVKSDDGTICSSCYIIQFLPSRGKFRVDKAQALGVKPGHLYAKLIAGENIVTEAGNTVRPGDVMDLPPTPPRVVVVDVPSREFVKSAIQMDWNQMLPDTSGSKRRKTSNKANQRLPSPEAGEFATDVKVMYHILGESVDPFDDSNNDYFEWMQSFGPEVIHYVSHKSYSPFSISLRSANILNQSLQKVLPNMFQTLKSWPATKRFPEKWSNIKNVYELDAVVLEPKIEGYSELAKIENSGSTLENSTQDSQLHSLLDLSSEAGQVITLGTGSSQPAKHRNVISSVFNRKGRSIMLDCGEGTLGSINRLFEKDQREELVANLEILYLSHLHADHHLGSISVIKEWLRLHEEDDKKLVVLAPGNYFRFLNQWSHIDQLNMSRLRLSDLEHYVSNKPSGPSLHSTRYPHQGPLNSQELENLGLAKISACRAIHCDWSYSTAFTYLDSTSSNSSHFTMAYSGDTRPNELFAKLCPNADLLIHEATHEDDLQEDAIAKRHSTISEAIQTATAMQARNLLLTHFSQRYPKIPAIGMRDYGRMKVAVAFDGMMVDLDNIAEQASKFEELERMFKKGLEEAVENTADLTSIVH